MKQHFLLATALCSLALATVQQPAFADGEEQAAGPWSATLAVTSDYRFRGQSQNDRNVAVQGSIEYTHTTGLFAGVWASQIDFSDTGDTDTSVEVDFYAGYNISLAEGTDASVKATYYLYPNNPASYEYWEVQGSLSHNLGVLALSGEVNYSSDYFNGTGAATAAAAGIDVPLAEILKVTAHYGKQWIDDNAAFGTDDYNYWDAGLELSWRHITLDARYVDTDLSNGECFGGTNLCTSGFVGTLTISLP